MNSYIIEIKDLNTNQKVHIPFSERETFGIRQKAGDKPVTPYIVDEIKEKAEIKGYHIEESKKTLFKIARDILVNGQGICSISGSLVKIEKPYGLEGIKERYEHTYENDNIEMEEVSPLTLIQYENSLHDLEKLTHSIMKRGEISIVWCKARGLVLEHLSKNYPLFDDIEHGELNDPVKLMRFIIKKPQDRIVYIFEDFHHYMGGKDLINPTVGEVRSLVKDLYRSLKGRNDRVCIFVPVAYELPEELEPFFYIPVKKKLKKGYLDKFAELLTCWEYISKTKPVIGVDNHIERMIQILGQMETNNPLIVGISGVGKTALVEGLAKVLFKGEVSSKLKDKQLYMLSLNSLVSGTRYRGDFETRLEGLMNEVLDQKDRIIVFVDEIHTLLDAGSTEGAAGAGEILKPVLARGEFPCIGATTPEGAKSFEKDPAFSRRFKKIYIKEPSVSKALDILKGISTTFEKHHGLKLTDEALITAVELSIRYIPEENLPGKAVSLLDGAAAYCSMCGKQFVDKNDIVDEIKRSGIEIRN
uniref:Magnetosome protein Mad27 n=1 Tax=Candidatus Magnetananas rongchengensis TaxID=1463558 RepID=A0A3Q8B7J0_9BACT|nr:magnetosome protein Mad27 [Candidatus Magnetananas rongchenensis]